jgi:ABC-2 type transport system permease protein
MQIHVLKALVKKELASYFTNPTGYVFITLFVFLSGVAAFWTPAFFDRNLANLDQLNAWFPTLLVLLVPAITMASWAQERQQGTDELLMTLPASEVELVVGKYLGAVTIYAVCLLFAAGHVAVLLFLGRPDLGVMASTYLAYFLAGAAMIGVGLAASSLTPSATISYIFGALCCGGLVALGLVERLVPTSGIGPYAAAVSLPRHMDSLTRGVIDPADLAYFVGVAVLGVSAAVVFVKGRRRVGACAGAGAGWLHVPARAAALVVLLVCGVILLDRTAVRVDATQERLWSVSPQTRRILTQLPADRPIVVTAYVSEKVPEAYVQQRETLVGLLREIESASRGRVQTRVIATEPNTAESREADKSFGIKPRAVPADTGTFGSTVPVFLGLVISGAGGTGGPETNVIEFLGRGLSPEYELARALRAAGQVARKKVGILDTPAGLYGQFDFQTMQPGRDWPIVAELRKQYEVVRVAPGSEYPAGLDLLLVAQPSSLKTDEIKRLAEWVKSGRATLIFEDPFPSMNPALATAEPNRPQGNPMMGRQPPDPKGSLAPLTAVLGVKVPGDAVLWDTANPHPMLAQTPEEFIWAGRASWKGALPPFNDDDDVTSGLQEVVLLFAGRVERESAKKPGDGGDSRLADASGPTVVPLIRSGPTSGTIAYANLVQRSLFGVQLNPNRRPARTNAQQTIAARVSGGPDKVNAIVVADLDMLSETFFSIREQGLADLEFDNVTFVLNAVDALTGDTELLELRKRRPQFRTLTRVEDARREQFRATADAIAVAEESARASLAEAQQRMDAKIREIEEEKDLDETTRRIKIETVRQGEQRRLDAQSAAIEDRRRQTVEDQRLQTRKSIESIQTGIRLAAVALPPIPALAVGVMVFGRRRAAATFAAADRPAGSNA